MSERPPSYVHRGGTVPLLGTTLDRHFREVAGRHPDRDALVSLHQGLRLSYAALDRETERLARGLLALGLRKGDRVGIWATNNAEWLLVLLATARTGTILVNVNPACRAGELDHALRLSGVRTLFLMPRFRSSDYVAMIRELRLDGLQLVLYDPARRVLEPPPGFLAWDEVLRRGDSVAPEEVGRRERSLDPDDPINIQFTSGTTGAPKAVTLTHHNILNNGHFVGKTLGFTERDRLCMPVPFYHCFGMVVSALACLSHGAALVLPSEHFDAGAALEAVERERCTALHGVPTMFVAELEHPDLARRDLSSLRTGIMAGAPCPPELLRRVIEEMGIRDLRVGYGQTEASPVTHMTREGDSFERRTGSVGTNLDHQETKVVDVRTGAVVPAGEAGEVCFRGYHVMRGYWGQEEATRKAIDPAGWLRSGDVGVMDGDGYLRITGRLKDMIIRGGEKVFPAEVEAFYADHPKVADVAVFGVPDPKMGEEVGAWIRVREGAEAEPEEFRAWARGRIAHFKIPRHVWIVKEFPMTVTGKIQKFRIREIVAGWMSEPRASAARRPEEAAPPAAPASPR
jgi:fatty-acyl-CoA synthase